MAEAEVLETEEVVTLEEKHLSATEETCVRVFYATRGKPEDQSDSVTQPLLQHKHPDRRDENHKADTQTSTDGPDRKTSVPQELESAGGLEPGHSGSVRSLCSDSSRHECPICSEPFDSYGDCRVTLLNCNHTLCHRCTAGVMSRAKDQSRLRCPFCRQTTPFPQWEIRRLQEESYSSCYVYEPGPALVVIRPGPELQATAVDAHRDTRGCCVHPSCLARGLMRPRSLCFSIIALLLLGCFLYMVVAVIMLSIVFSNA